MRNGQYFLITLSLLGLAPNQETLAIPAAVMTPGMYSGKGRRPKPDLTKPAKTQAYRKGRIQVSGEKLGTHKSADAGASRDGGKK